MQQIHNICATLLRLYNHNVNGNHHDRLTTYFAYFRDLSEHNRWVRATDFIDNFYLVQAYLNPMHHQLQFRFVDAFNRTVPHIYLHSNPVRPVNHGLFHVFGGYDYPPDVGDNWDRAACEIIKSLPEWGNDDMYTIFECGRTLLFGG